MIPQISDMATVVERLEKLEKQNRGLKQIGALTLVLAAAVLLMGQLLPTQSVEAQTPATRTVEGNEFVLRDVNGKQRAVLGTAPNGTPFFDMMDANGQQRVHLSTGLLVVFDANGKQEIYLGGRSGTFGPILQFSPTGGPSVSLDAGELTPGLLISGFEGQGHGSLQMRCLDTSRTCVSELELMGSGQSRARLQADKDNSYLMVGEAPKMTFAEVLSGRIDEAKFDEPRPGVWLGAKENGSSLELQDRQGFSTSIGNTGFVTARTGQTRQTSAASVVLLDKDKHVLWQAP